MNSNETQIKMLIENWAAAVRNKNIEGILKHHSEDFVMYDVRESVQQKNGDVREGKRKLVNVMIKDNEKYSSTGGWGFEEFIGDNKTEPTIKETAISKCFNCHSVKKESDFVFSKYRD